MPVAMQCKAFYQELTSQLTRSLMLGVRSGGRIACLTLSFLVLASLPGPTEAAMVKGLYSQEVPVTGQGYKERADAMSRALAGVLVKVAGQREVLSNSVIQSAMSKPETYIRRFGFRIDDTSLNRQQVFQATFDEKAVNRLLRSANVAIWGQSRPSTLVWLAIENGGRRSIINASEAFPDIFAESFQERGLPVLFPLMDFEDSAAISAVDVWGGFSGKIQEASRRYGSESILAGRLSRSLSQDNELFYGRLSLIFRGVSQSVAVDGLDAVGVTQLAADLVGSTLSRHYGIDASDASGKTLLMVENVSSLEDYAALHKYLGRMTAIRGVSVHKVNGSTVELELTIDGSERQLADSLALGRNLRAVSSGMQGVSDTGSSVMVYRWSR
ncbi:DUF2066 domain-containing protein [Endozoicomonas elysicola]|uniref:DUF2066 domain-containing protein n=1 Tax=Endozoicomonas elysicola TaxID=305900 RepID=A0A081KE96_9GAMM|nr:DUF2066 domain-containing protein [Endozoicomonas elysicola]KEI72472.1 hypothetical protein GV64_18605 [Endozoicomonas elysicola]